VACMSTATLFPPPRPLPSPARKRSLARFAGAPRREAGLFTLAVSAIALHVVDDSFLQPDAGTSAADHLLSGLLPLALLALAVWSYGRLHPGWRGTLALVLGPLALAGGAEAFHYTRHLGASGDDFTGFASLAAGVGLIVLGAVTLFRARRTNGSLGGRTGRRALLAVAGFLIANWIVMPVGAAYIYTHTARAVVPADRLGVPHEDVSFTTEDGLELEGWYIPSRNGAAVIAFAGRNGPQKPARMLARHGYGVLLFDRRGEGHSEGRPNALGWGADRDVRAAVDYLQTRADVDPGRIAGLGLSVGGELMLEAAAKDARLKAVVSEGAGFRALSEELDMKLSGPERVLSTVPTVIKHASVRVFSDTKQPRHLEDLVGRIAPRPALLIAAPNSHHGEDLNRRYHAAGPSTELWEIPESDHVGGLTARPAEYERRVVRFLDAALR
jgi:uncharacterized protein